MTIRNKIGASVMFIGLMFAVGSIGAIERDAVSLAQGFIQSVAFLGVAVLGAFVGDLFD